MEDYQQNDPECHPKKQKTLSTFKMSLDDLYKCGGMSILNKVNGKRTFIHHIIVERQDNSTEKLSAQCVIPGHSDDKLKIQKRAVLPAGFQEQDVTDADLCRIRFVVSISRALLIVLTICCDQTIGKVDFKVHCDNDTMLVKLRDLIDEFFQVYLIVRVLIRSLLYQISCSVDPFLFENFNTLDGDSLKAKFRAFKFPDSNYVQFKGTVNVCLDKCRGAPLKF
ncbi:uncharacterized protein LOC113471767 [Diaphorina citri]|uniref:Uncharacterized protein LOC113471767 n=1 Tax=Diaphorina citri TaxID=121845 RepID=A0A3Q0JJJ2_DIACI|nr:uncharacterized protein LOC113471767 [Diaphorina citri]